ncbi:NAD(P)H-dependent oxidoreductase subunit E [Aminobacter anthyllidis]|uniref:(2Fe-2S) ferredoxin domain-containing protein n=1 Tax=Aminobacter anthyllidis TaxID=1035067 RepID=UPI0024557267|nr:(2Fe-2S) ferredoxin domain-containing protein [Aminobacter anthyllidis]MDH4986214.1 NAD(P)H-dependent oxidoreductase subunit E [Aminobacter anthyllidis]
MPIAEIETAPSPPKRAVVLIAKSAFAAAPHKQMQRLADLAATLPGVDHASFGFTEQGTPSLREALSALRQGEFSDILLLPLMLPVEPSFTAWLTKSLRRWQAEDDLPWPHVRIAHGLAESPLLPALMAELVAGGDAASPVPPLEKLTPEGSLVPAQKRRVLVCQGGPCNAAGADLVWGHLRNQQERLKLRVTGDGTMTAKSTCLGPCNLAPVLQVFPEGTYYGGVTETAIDRIVTEHLLGGVAVEDFAYQPTGRKQVLRDRPATGGGEQAR